jgi:sarcosine oxidase gamma subunit
VVLWRPDEQSLRLLVVRSFAAYVWALLRESAGTWQSGNLPTGSRHE